MAKSVNTVNFNPQGVGGFVRKGAITLGLLVLSAVVGSASCTRVDPGHVGIRVKLAGSARGVQDAPIVAGWVAYNPITEMVVEFPTSVQNIVWSKDPHEGAVTDESITFAGKDGQVVIDQLRTVDKARLAARLGVLDADEAASVLDVLKEFFAA